MSDGRHAVGSEDRPDSGALGRAAPGATAPGGAAPSPEGGGEAALDKAALRRRLLAARRALPDAERAAGDDARDAVLAPLLAARRVAAYSSSGTEPRTTGLVGPDVLLPVLLPDRDLDWERAGEPGRLLGRDALATCEVVLVPALAVDRTGVRLGRGGGSYDRALRRTSALVVALLHPGELLQALPAEPHDVPVAAVALPSGLVDLSRSEDLPHGTG